MWSGLESEIHGVATGLSLVSTNLEKINKRVERYIGAMSHLTEADDNSATVFALGLVNGLKEKLRTLDLAPKSVVEDSSHLAKEAERSEEIADVASCGAALSSILVVYEALSRHYSDSSPQLTHGVQTFKQVKATIVSTVANLPHPPDEDDGQPTQRRPEKASAGREKSHTPPPPATNEEEYQNDSTVDNAPAGQVDSLDHAATSTTRTTRTVVKRRRKKKHADPLEAEAAENDATLNSKGLEKEGDSTKGAAVAATGVAAMGTASLSAQLAAQQQQGGANGQQATSTKSSIDAWREELGTPTPKEGNSPDNSMMNKPPPQQATAAISSTDAGGVEEEDKPKKSRGFLGAGVALVTAPFRGAKKVATVVANPGESMREAHLSTFRKKFPQIANSSSSGSDEVIDITNCAWKEKKVLKQGHWFLTRTHIAFVSSVLSGEFSVPLREIQKIEKKKNAVVFDNSIEITTLEGESFFITSFIKRDESFRLLHGLWTNA